MMRSSKTLWDQLDNRQIIRDMLAPTDYEITETENGEEALAAIRLADKTIVIWRSPASILPPSRRK
jgi:CheY-like chemotaxis protein